MVDVGGHRLEFRASDPRVIARVTLLDSMNSPHYSYKSCEFWRDTV